MVRGIPVPEAPDPPDMADDSKTLHWQSQHEKKKPVSAKQV